MKPNQKTQLTLSDDLLKAAQSRAERDSETLSDTVAKALAAYLKKQKTDVKRRGG